jgi:putative copper export protein/methionine-rich copper-binding protein CopC
MRHLRLTILAVILLAAALFAAEAARAHSSYKQSDPTAATRIDRTVDSIRIQFSQPFNRSLTKIELFDAATGLPYSVEFSVPRPGVAVVLPTAGNLPSAPYRMRWHTVGAYDGHVLEGTFGFGVRAAAPADAAPRLTSSPFEGWGLLRISLRAVMLICLFFFAGGVLVPALLRVPGGHAAWLVPSDERGLEHGAFLKRLESRTLTAGYVTVGTGAVAALVDAVAAGGSLMPDVLGAYLLTNVSGVSRLAMLLLLAGAVVLLTKGKIRLASVMVTVAFLAVAIGGHSFSPVYRYVAITSDWLHLVAAAVWAGGIGQLALTWVPRIFGRSGGLRRAVMRDVLNRFGRVAMPAFVVVAISGSVNALIRLGKLPALWETTYGRVLFVKVTLIGLIALASYLHAMKLRPRLLATIRPQLHLERRHWRLIGSEPLLIAAAIAAVAVLVAFPLPPGQTPPRDDDQPIAARTVPKAQSNSPASLATRTP